MPLALTDQDLRQLRSLVPLHTLSDAGFSQLMGEVRVEAANRGQTIFREGDTVNENIYLLDGQLALKADNRVVEQIAAGSNTARFPIGHQLPRKYTAQVTSGARFVRIDSRRLSDVLAHEHTVDYQVNDFDDDSANDDWMTQLLQSRVLQQIPASNIQRVMMKVKQIEVTAGEIVIRQGEPGDYYYMLNRGKAVVSRDAGGGGPPIELARLGPGASFGEEALLSNSPRNSTITMLTDGVLLRLSKHDFVELIHHPVAEQHDFAEASDLVANGALWLDVRRTDAFEKGHLPGSVNLPFDVLRQQIDSLTPERRYVLVGDNGNGAAAAAFFLLEHGLEVSVLQGGYEAAQQELTAAESEAPIGADDQSDAPTALTNKATGQTDASARIQALEQRIRELELEQNNAGAERQASLNHLKDAIEKARHRMLAVDQERKAAMQERDLARADVEQVNRRVQEVELEREGMRQRLVDLERKEQIWQERLRKAEAAGIGERDKAESASQQLEEAERHLKAARQDQLEMREANARQTGELKEEVTALQLDFELVRSDYEALQAIAQERESQLATVTKQAGDFEQTVRELERRCAHATSEAENSAKQLDELRQTAGDGDAAREQLASQLRSMEQQLASRDEELAGRDRELDKDRKDLQTATDRIEQIEAELQRAQTLADEQAQGQEALEQRLAEMDTLQSETTAQSEELTAQLQVKQSEIEHLDSERTTLEQSKGRLERELTDLRETITGLEEQRQRQEEDAVAMSEAQREENRQAIETLAAREAELSDTRDRLAAQEAEKQVSDAELAAHVAETEALQRDVQELQTALSVAKEKLVTAEHAETELASKDQALEGLRAELTMAEQRNDEISTQLHEASQVFDVEQQRLIAELQAARTANQEFEARQRDCNAGSSDTKDFAEQNNTRLAALEQENEQLLQSLDVAGQEKQKLVAEAAAVAEAFEEQLADAAHEVTQWQQRLTQLEATHREVIEERDRLKTDLAGVASELDQLEALQEHANGLVQQLEEVRAARLDAEQSVIALRGELELAQSDAEERHALDASPMDAEGGALSEWQLRYDNLKEQQAAVTEERDAARAEAQELRSVIEKYVARIEAAQDSDPDELAALKTELTMVRDQAEHDVHRLRAELDKAQSRIRELELSDSVQDPLNAEALRQEVASLKEALTERQRELSSADQNRQQIEDQLEDAAREIERLKREAAVDMSQLFDDQAASPANSAFQVGRNATDPADVIDDLLENGLRDHRITPPRRAVDIEKVTGASRAGQIALGVLIGLVLVLGGLELALLLSGRGELFRQLFSLGIP